MAGICEVLFAFRASLYLCQHHGNTRAAEKVDMDELVQQASSAGFSMSADKKNILQMGAKIKRTILVGKEAVAGIVGKNCSDLANSCGVRFSTRAVYTYGIALQIFRLQCELFANTPLLCKQARIAMCTGGAQALQPDDADTCSKFASYSANMSYMLQMLGTRPHDEQARWVHMLAIICVASELTLWADKCNRLKTELLHLWLPLSRTSLLHIT